MSAVDTAWLRMDGPANAMMIVSVMATATPVPPDALRRVLETRLLCFPRFRQRVESDALGASWIEDEQFDLDEHLILTALPGAGGPDALQALVGELASQRLDPSRPLWQMHFVASYGAGSAWILRLHHCYADGIAMVRVLLSLTEQDAGPALTGASREPRSSPPAADTVESALADGARLFESFLQKLLHPGLAAAVASQATGMAGELANVLALPDDPPSPLRSELSGQKRVAWSQPLALDEVKLVSRTLGCTVNDVLMATFAGALGAYLREHHGFDTRDVTLRASVPINLRDPAEAPTLGNRFGLMFVDMPLGVANPLQRAYAMHDTLRHLKSSRQPTLTLAMLGLLGLMPSVVQAPTIELFSRKGSLVASNVPGPPAPLYLCGQRIAEMHFWVPQSGSIGVGASVLSYAGKVCYGLIADRACIPEPRHVTDRMAPEFERLLLATTIGALGRRPARKARPRKTRARAPVGNT